MPRSFDALVGCDTGDHRSPYPAALGTVPSGGRFEERLGFPARVSASDDLDATIEESHRALDAFVKGDPGPLQALFSQREDVTLANPFGPAQRGWPRVRDTLARAAEHYRDGRAVGFDLVSEHVTAELASIHELERFQAKVGGSEEMTAVSLRCTSVFRLEDGGWKIVHRHADPITVTQPAASVTDGK